MTIRRIEFDVAADALTFDNPNSVAFKVSKETRTIKGLALPFGDVGDNGWDRWTFDADTEFRWGKPKLLNAHDWSQILGVLDLEVTAEGLLMTAKVAATTRGDEVLALADIGAIDGLSVGLGAAIDYDVIDGVNHVRSCKVEEVSTTPIPAFENAAIRSVAASAAPQEGSTMHETPEAGAATFATADQVADLATQVAELKDLKVPAPSGAQFQVKEEPVYRFAGSERAPSGYDFAEDLLAAGRGDKEAEKRVIDFSRERVAAGRGPRFVDSADVTETYPAQHRPDMFLGQAPTPRSPLYDFFHKGSLTSLQPFYHSKLDRSATDVSVSNHVEGTDPSDDDLVTAAGATVTPSAVSGKVHITREVGDIGGNPNVSALVWAEFERSWDIALETKTMALLTASWSAMTSLTASIAAGADGAAAGAAIEKGLVGLQFAADGDRFTHAFGHVDLYTELATYENADGEKRYPIINPANRSGVSGSQYSFIDIAGYRMTPAASLGATSANPSNSLVADRNAVHVWNSGLQRLDKLEEKVEGWDLGVFGYFAGLVYDISGLRKIAYDPTA